MFSKGVHHRTLRAYGHCITDWTSVANLAKFCRKELDPFRPVYIFYVVGYSLVRTCITSYLGPTR